MQGSHSIPSRAATVEGVGAPDALQHVHAIATFICRVESMTPWLTVSPLDPPSHLI